MSISRTRPIDDATLLLSAQWATGARPSGEALATPGELIDHFRVMRQLGSGGMGEVYLARDTLLGRKVAIKLVQRQLLDRASTRTQFMNEARTTAKFSHPNIVQIHAVGEHEGAPYVALEYIEGDTLASRIESEALSVRETLRLMSVVALAVQEAHRHGVLHRDLKPENIIIARDGRLRVLDFGLAIPRTAEATDHEHKPAETAVGTPAYMAPEQWLQMPCSEATDVWAMGVMLYELLNEQLPFPADTLLELAKAVCGPGDAPRADALGNVPERLADLVARCLHKVPDERPSAAEVARELGSMLATGPEVSDEVCPFRGLLAFTHQHARLFHGREADVAALVERIRLEPMLTLVGASGAGKSSLVHAGVVPRLREQGRWTVLSLRPGNKPFRALAKRVLRQQTSMGSQTRQSQRTPPEGDEADAIDELIERLGQEPHALGLALRRLADERGGRLLLVVDQLEELYTLVADESLRAGFLRAITLAADDAAEPVRVVCTLRDDFLGRLASSAGAGDAFSHVAVVKALGDAELRDVLVKPLEMVDYRYEDDDLPGEMIAEVAGEPACLPLLSFAARKLWDSRDSERRMLTRSSYETMGGVAGALARHADGLLEGLSPDELDMARRLLLMLVTPERTRRRLTRARVLAAVGAEGSGEGTEPPATTSSSMAEGVLTRLIEGRLITVSRARQRADASLELTHESLVHTWSTLSRWLDETKDELVFLAELEQAALLWDKRGRRADELWGGEALAEARRMQRRIETRVDGDARAFLRASEARAGERETRRRTLRLGVTVAAVVVAALAVTAAFYVSKKEREARQQASLAEQRRAQALYEGALAAYQQGLHLEARAKLRTALEIEDSSSARMLWWRLSSDAKLWSYRLGRRIVEADWAPDGERVAIGASDGSIRVIDAATLSSQLLRASGEDVLALSYGSGGELAAGDHSGDVTLWDAQGSSRRILRGHRAGVLDASFSGDGHSLVTGGIDRQVIVWDVKSGKPRATLNAPTPVPSVSFEPQGRRIIWCTMSGEVVVWDLASRKQQRRHRAHAGSCYRIAYSHDGKLYATGGTDHLVKIWDADSGKLKHEIVGHRDNVTGLHFNPEGTLLASGSWDSDVRIWDVASGEMRQLLEHHDDSVPLVAFAPAGGRLLSASSDGTVQLHRVSGPQQPPRPAAHRGEVHDIAFAKGDSMLVSCDNDGRLVMWDASNGEPQRSFDAHDGACNDVTVSADGQLATAGADNLVNLWSLDGRLQHSLRGHRSHVAAVSFSHDGNILHSGGADGVIRRWDPRKGEPLENLGEGTDYDTSLAFLPHDDGLIVAGRSPVLRIVDPESGKLNKSLRGGATVYLRALPSPDGTRIAATTLANALHLFDLSGDNTTPTIIKTDSPTMGLAWHPDSTRVAFGTGAGAITLRHVIDGSQTWLHGGHHSSVRSIAIARDGRRLASAAHDRTVRLWDLQTNTPLWRAPLLSRDNWLWSHRGWMNLDGTSPVGPPPGWSEALAQTVERRARYVDEGARHTCVLTLDGLVELWPNGADAAATRTTDEAISAVVATDDGCLYLDAGHARLLQSGRKPQDMFDGASAIAYQRQHSLIALKEEVVLLAAGASQHIPHRGDVTAVGLLRSGEEAMVGIGYRNGTVELAQLVAAPRIPLERAPASAPLRIIAGPSDTVFVGFANGAAGLWSASGKQLWLEHLHGPVIHARLNAEHLFIASDLGAYLVWDLRDFFTPRCQLLRTVWDAVPVEWHNGRAVRAAPPAKHPCHAQ